MGRLYEGDLGDTAVTVPRTLWRKSRLERSSVEVRVRGFILAIELLCNTNSTSAVPCVLPVVRREPTSVDAALGGWP